MRWEKWKGSEVAKWKRRQSGKLGRWEVPFLSKGVERRESPRFHLFVSDVNQWNAGGGFSCVSTGMERHS